MTGIFNEKAQAILRNAEVNGGLTSRNLFDLIVASHDESVQVAEKLAQTVEAASLLRATERAELHTWQQAQAARCAEEHRKLFEEEIANVVSVNGYERERYDRGVRRKFMSTSTKYVIMVIIVVMLGTLAYTVLSEHHDLTADLATGLSSTIAVTMLIWAFLRKDKP